MTQPALNLQQVYVALGANLQRPDEQIRAGFEELAMLPNTRLDAVSSLYRSAPVGHLDQPDFINAVAAIGTTLSPRALLEALLEIEVRYGRVRDFPNAPRTLDLDIILYAGEEVDEPGLTIPHPRMHERAFVLIPLAEIAPDATIPRRGRLRDLVAAVDAASVEKIES